MLLALVSAFVDCSTTSCATLLGSSRSPSDPTTWIVPTIGGCRMQINLYDPGAIDEDSVIVICFGPVGEGTGTKNVFQNPDPVYSGGVAPLLVGHANIVGLGALAVKQLPKTA